MGAISGPHVTEKIYHFFSYSWSVDKMSSDNHVKEYRRQIERKTERMQNEFNNRMIRTTLNQVTRDKNTVMEFIRNERDEKKRENLWDIFRHLTIFIQIYDGCGPEERKKPSFFRSSQVIWKMMRAQTEGGRKLFLISTSSACYGLDTHFYSYQVTIKGVKGNHLELLDPYMERLESKCLLGEINDEPIVPFSPLSSARLQSILDISNDPEPVTRDETSIGQEEDQFPGSVLDNIPESVPLNPPTPAERDFDEESDGWFDLVAQDIIAKSAATGKPKPIVSHKIYLLPIILGIIIFWIIKM